MAADNIVGPDLKSQVEAKFDVYPKTMAFLRRADAFMITWKVPQNVHRLLYRVFFYANSINTVILIVRQISEIMTGYENLLLAEHFQPPTTDAGREALEAQKKGTVEMAYEWAVEECKKLDIESIDEELASVKEWLEWTKTQPDKAYLQTQSQDMFKALREIPQDAYATSWSAMFG